MNKHFEHAFNAALDTRYDGVIPDNGTIAIHIVQGSSLTYLSQESVRKWRLGKATPQLRDLMAISQWLDKQIVIDQDKISFVTKVNI